jgi:hypothetical protein
MAAAGHDDKMGCSKNKSKIGNMVIEYCCDELLAFVTGRKGS